MQRRFAAAPSFLGQWPRDGRAVAGNATLQDFEAHCEAMPAAGPAIISPIMGIDRTEVETKARGLSWMVTVTTVREAEARVAAGAGC